MAVGPVKFDKVHTTSLYRYSESQNSQTHPLMGVACSAPPTYKYQMFDILTHNVKGDLKNIQFPES